MSLESLLAGLENRSAVTSVTSVVTADVTADPAPVVDCTPVTCVTSESECGQDNHGLVLEEFEERAAIMEFDGGLSREQAEHGARDLNVAPRGLGSH